MLLLVIFNVMFLMRNVHFTLSLLKLNLLSHFQRANKQIGRAKPHDLILMGKISSNHLPELATKTIPTFLQ